MEVRMDIATVGSVLQCPMCDDYILPPILQCEKGHIICTKCRHKWSRCAICWEYLGNIRNLALEQLASTLMFPCKYSTSGCAVSILYTERREHERTCEFRQYSCSYQDGLCSWQGSIDQVVPHLMKSHKLVTPFGDEDGEITVPNNNKPQPVDWACVISCFGHNFFVILKKLETFDGYRHFFVTVQLIGSRKKVEKFEYRLEINGQRRSMTWKATPRYTH